MTGSKIPMGIIRERTRFFDEVVRGEGIGGKAWALLGWMFLFFFIYGAIIGSAHSFAQAAVSAVKLPVLYLLTLIICFPTLYIFNTLFGSKQTVGQYFVILLSTVAVTSLLLVAFAPITVFFLITADHYQFFKLLNVAIFAITGCFGVGYFHRGMLHFAAVEDAALEKAALDEGVAPEKADGRRVAGSALEAGSADDTGSADDIGGERAEPDKSAGIPAKNFSPPGEGIGARRTSLRKLLASWILLYAFVGSQLAWTIRPFFGNPDSPFSLFRELGGNFYTNIVEAVGEILGFR